MMTENRHPFNNLSALDMIESNNKDYLYALARRCEHLLSDSALNNNRKFRLAVEQNLKGYVHFKLFLQDIIIKDIFNEIGESLQKNQEILLKRAIISYSDKLKANTNSIRRMIAYKNRIKEKKAILIDQYPVNWTKEDLISVLDIHCEVYCTLLKQQNGLVYGLIYCEDPHQIIQKSQQMQEKYGFIIHNYTVYIANKESYQSIRKSQINPHVYHQNGLKWLNFGIRDRDRSRRQFKFPNRMIDERQQEQRIQKYMRKKLNKMQPKMDSDSQSDYYQSQEMYQDIPQEPYQQFKLKNNDSRRRKQPVHLFQFSNSQLWNN